MHNSHTESVVEAKRYCFADRKREGIPQLEKGTLVIIALLDISCIHCKSYSYINPSIQRSSHSTHSHILSIVPAFAIDSNGESSLDLTFTSLSRIHGYQGDLQLKPSKDPRGECLMINLPTRQQAINLVIASRGRVTLHLANIRLLLPLHANTFW